MKELSIKEKAKRYDEILTRAKGVNFPYYNKDIMTKVKEFVDYLIPELKESEDEKTKRILDIITYKMSQHQPDIFTGEENEWFNAWIEKQGEHKKFLDSIQVGDKVTRNEDGVLINLSQLNRVAKKDEKQGEQRSKLVDFDLNANDSDLQEETYFIPNGFHAEIISDKVVIKKGEQKHWSEDDEMKLNITIAYLLDVQDFKLNAKNCIDWLKSLKDRVQTQPQQEWSDEDERRISSILLSIKYCKEQYADFRDYQYDIYWMNELKDRVQPKHGMSEKEGKMLDEMHEFFDKHKFPSLKHDMDDYAKLLESLKDRYTWKPSEE